LIFLDSLPDLFISLTSLLKSNCSKICLGQKIDIPFWKSFGLSFNPDVIIGSIIYTKNMFVSRLIRKKEVFGLNIIYYSHIPQGLGLSLQQNEVNQNKKSRFNLCVWFCVIN
jgi:hypothetical protein